MGTSAAEIINDNTSINKRLSGLELSHLIFGKFYLNNAIQNIKTQDKTEYRRITTTHVTRLELENETFVYASSHIGDNTTESTPKLEERLKDFNETKNGIAYFPITTTLSSFGKTRRHTLYLKVEKNNEGSNKYTLIDSNAGNSPVSFLFQNKVLKTVKETIKKETKEENPTISFSYKGTQGLLDNENCGRLAAQSIFDEVPQSNLSDYPAPIVDLSEQQYEMIVGKSILFFNELNKNSVNDISEEIRKDPNKKTDAILSLCWLYTEKHFTENKLNILPNDNTNIIEEQIKTILGQSLSEKLINYLNELVAFKKHCESASITIQLKPMLNQVYYHHWTFLKQAIVKNNYQNLETHVTISKELRQTPPKEESIKAQLDLLLNAPTNTSEQQSLLTKYTKIVFNAVKTTLKALATLATKPLFFAYKQKPVSAVKAYATQVNNAVKIMVPKPA